MFTNSNFVSVSLGDSITDDQESMLELLQLLLALEQALQLGLAGPHLDLIVFKLDLVVDEGGVLGRPWPLHGE